MKRWIPLAVLLSLGALSASQDDVFFYDEGAVELSLRPSGGEPPKTAGEIPGKPALPASARELLAERSAKAFVGDWDFVGSLLVWDEYNHEGRSFDVLGAHCPADVGAGQTPLEKRPSAPFVIASGPRFQARPRVSAFLGGAVGAERWVAWEEGPEGYGHAYRSVDRTWNNATDVSGPLHSWRAVRVAMVLPSGDVFPVPVPMPGFGAAKGAAGRRSGAEKLGVFYERPEIAFDDDGFLWLGYRHMRQAQLALRAPTKTHIEQGFGVYLARLRAGGWDSLSVLPTNQRNGGQVLRLAPQGRGVRAFAEVGRRDRRGAKGQPLWAVADAAAPALTGGGSALLFDGAALRAGGGEGRRDAPEPSGRIRPRPMANVGDKEFTLLFGDLHRHTDLSLCFPFYDGSLDDAYRYARGPGALDFVAITDHARDLDKGRAAGLPWARSVEAVNDHHAPGDFVAFYSFERSQNDTDHNVIGLRSNILRPHTPPLRDYWAEFSEGEILTIPHATSPVPGKRFGGNVWTKRDDVRRPLAEVYQSCRNVDSFDELRRKALSEGQRLGFIASSDHLSTSGAYACAWVEGAQAEALDRPPIFRALQQRRTYGATARIELRAMCGDAWMGEELTTKGPFRIEVEVQGTAPMETIEFWTEDGLAHSLTAEADDPRMVAAWSWPGPAAGSFGYCAVVIRQTDGERAWASPFFAGWDAAGKRAY